jgi:hypothetical protein
MPLLGAGVKALITHFAIIQNVKTKRTPETNVKLI